MRVKTSFFFYCLFTPHQIYSQSTLPDSIFARFPSSFIPTQIFTLFPGSLWYKQRDKIWVAWFTNPSESGVNDSRLVFLLQPSHPPQASCLYPFPTTVHSLCLFCMFLLVTQTNPSTVLNVSRHMESMICLVRVCWVTSSRMLTNYQYL